MKIVETLPNISEGKNKELINRIKDLSENFDKIWFISCKSDEYFNRSFISVVGELNEIEDFLIQMVKICGGKYKISEIIVGIIQNRCRRCHPDCTANIYNL